MKVEEARRYIRVCLFALLFLAAIMSGALVVRWISLLLLSISLLLFLLQRLAGNPLDFRPAEIYSYEEPVHVGDAERLSNAIVRASRGYKLSRGLIWQRVVGLLARDPSSTSESSLSEAREFSRERGGDLAADELPQELLSLKGANEVTGEEYLALLGSILDEVLTGGDLDED